MQLQETINAIEVENLCFAYEKQKVLDNINLVVKNNDFVTILGPNGGGKSTLLKLILGINSLQKGSIKVLGKPSSSKIQHIGYVPQNTNINLNFPITVLEVVMMGQSSFFKRLFGFKQDEKEKALDALTKVNMQDFASNKISDLSGGQRQRVFIARALFSEPKILLLDEPTSNIDIQGSEQIYATLQELNKDITIVVISHDISIILQYASKAVYINKTCSYHDLTQMKQEFHAMDSHVCEVELLEMLGRCRC